MNLASIEDCLYPVENLVEFIEKHPEVVSIATGSASKLNDSIYNTFFGHKIEPCEQLVRLSESIATFLIELYKKKVFSVCGQNVHILPTTNVFSYKNTPALTDTFVISWIKDGPEIPEMEYIQILQQPDLEANSDAIETIFPSVSRAIDEFTSTSKTTRPKKFFEFTSWYISTIQEQDFISAFKKLSGSCFNGNTLEDCFGYRCRINESPNILLPPTFMQCDVFDEYRDALQDGFEKKEESSKKR